MSRSTKLDWGRSQEIDR